MTNAIRRLSDWTLALVAPGIQAAAQRCDPAPWYQYRCAGGQNWQRRRCHSRCDCSTSCGSWVTIGQCPI